jgi:hypothetical protein
LSVAVLDGNVAQSTENYLESREPLLPVNHVESACVSDDLLSLLVDYDRSAKVRLRGTAI